MAAIWEKEWWEDTVDWGENLLTGEEQTQAAIEAQRRAADEANATQRYIFDQTRADLEPWRQTGMGALSQLSQGVLGYNPNAAANEQAMYGRGGKQYLTGDGTVPENMPVKMRGGTPGFAGPQDAPGGGGGGPGLMDTFTLSDFEKDPGYQFRLDEGMKALEASAAARGNLNSGRTLKELTRYGQDYASNEYTNAYNRFNADRDQRFNKLSSLAGLGQTSTGQMISANQNYGNNLSANQIGLGNAIASANIAQANRMSQLLGQGAQGLGTYMASDKRLKTDIKPIPKEDLDEFKSTIKPYMYKYIDPSNGHGEWPGVMAQDLRKSKLGRMIVFEDSQGFFQINLKKLMSLLLAAMAEGAA